MAREIIVDRSGLGTGGSPFGIARAGTSWKSRYLSTSAVADAACALLAGMVAFELRYHARVEPPAEYLADQTEGRGLTGRADAVALPGSTAEVAAAVAWCYDHDVPIVPRGGSSMPTSACG